MVLAPMADVTDAAFRRIIAKYGKPNVFWTEFVSADGLVSKGREVLLRDLAYTEAERPIVAQLFTGTPEKMEQAAALVATLGFDGLDINMGCPDKSIEKQGAGAALSKDPERACAVIRAAKRGIQSAGKYLPVSVKIRLGYNKDELDSWLPALLAEDPAAVTIHARTRKEMSKVPAHWERIRDAVQIRDDIGSRTYILGNGDAANIEDARAKIRASGADGVMLGRAIFGNPWLFSLLGGPETLRERLIVAAEHARLFDALLRDIKSFNIMKKHFKAYIEGFVGAKELRLQLMEAQSGNEVTAIIEGFLEKESRTLRAYP